MDIHLNQLFTNLLLLAVARLRRPHFERLIELLETNSWA